MMKSLNNQRLLISFAHPDDESFGMGGAIAYYVQRGVDVSLICATNGEAGTVDPQYLQGYNTIGELRLNELHCAAETLGIKEVITYGYRDSGMMGTPDNDHPDCLWQADEDVVTGRIVRDIRRIRPQVVVTFDPWGGYGHPDHIFMHRATTRAFHAAGDPAQYPEHLNDGLEPYRPAKLYYNTFPRAILRTRVWLARLHGENPRRIGRNQDIDLVDILKRQLPADARIHVGPYQHVWDDASGCHASQMNPRQTSSLIDWLVRLFYRHQYFTRAWPVPDERDPQERDLFEGIA
jgi:N-acetyl-1-D-myo-inositol-2-amino-2-deoxy-alpha-D-glucopyranoside deacetylase